MKTIHCPICGQRLASGEPHITGCPSADLDGTSELVREPAQLDPVIVAGSSIDQIAEAVRVALGGGGPQCPGRPRGADRTDAMRLARVYVALIPGQIPRGGDELVVAIAPALGASLLFHWSGSN